MTLTCSAKKAFFFTFSFLFTVHRSFKNLAKEGTCLIVSNKGILILTYLKVLRIFIIVIDFPLFGHGMRKWKCCGESAFSLQYSYSIPSLPSEINSSSFSQGSRVGFSITLPLRRVMTDLT